MLATRRRPHRLSSRGRAGRRPTASSALGGVAMSTRDPATRETAEEPSARSAPAPRAEADGAAEPRAPAANALLARLRGLAPRRWRRALGGVALLVSLVAGARWILESWNT